MEKIGHSEAKEINLDLNIIPYIEMNSKWTTDLNIKRKTVKLLGKKIE